MNTPQVSRDEFSAALLELGHDPIKYEGQRISLEGMSELYEMSHDAIVEAIHSRYLSAHYDYKRDTIWIDALEAAHFFYCVHADGPLFATAG